MSLAFRRPLARLSSPRIAAVLLGVAAGGAVVWTYAEVERARESARYEAQRRRLRDLVREHAAEAVSPRISGSKDSSVASLDAERSAPNGADSHVAQRDANDLASDRRALERRRRYLTPDLAAQLFVRDTSIETFDPWCYFRHKPGLSIRVPWEEHPSGAWTFTTNSLGLREDRELSKTPPDLRVIVTGDSHTDGFCDGAHSYPHTAEAELRARHTGRSIEIVNAGNGGFSFYNYAGVLERMIDLAPDAFVVAVYAGNDFAEVLVPHAYFRAIDLPTETPADLEEIARGRDISIAAMVQAFHEILYFRRHPEAIEPALRAAASVATEMRALTGAHRIRLMLILIPGPTSVPWGENAALFERFARELALTTHDIEVSDRLSDVLLGFAKEHGIETLDARPIFRAETGPLYWKKDLHTNLRANAALGHALAQRIESWGGKLAR
jgi:hypothetical protein